MCREFLVLIRGSFSPWNPSQGFGAAASQGCPPPPAGRTLRLVRVPALPFETSRGLEAVPLQPLGQPSHVRFFSPFSFKDARGLG